METLTKRKLVTIVISEKGYWAKYSPRDKGEILWNDKIFNSPTKYKNSKFAANNVTVLMIEQKALKNQ